MTSAPISHWYVIRKAKTFSWLELLQLTMVLIKLDMLTVGTLTATGITFTIDLVNSGTQAISNIQLIDELRKRCKRHTV
ncbi:MAG: hypothetical protein R2912_09050 [Eubacteriales bacterium]